MRVEEYIILGILSSRYSTIAVEEISYNRLTMIANEWIMQSVLVKGQWLVL